VTIADLVIGRRLANAEAGERRIGVFAGLPAMGLDGLSSAAYGPETALSVLAVAGAGGLAYLQPIFWIILLLLGILYLSYRQTIAAYPSNGGSYTVSKDNLGTRASLLAAVALMLDYIMNVAVGISAGVDAIISAFPAAAGLRVSLCLAVLVLVTLLNLRGTKESGVAFSLPTYVFVASLGFILVWGAVKVVLSHGHPAAVIAPPALPPATQAVTLWLLMRVFASGCTAMTGVEAVSNGVSAFREPKVRRAHATLGWIVGLLAFLLLGVAYVARFYGIGAMDESQPGYQSVLSQIVDAVYGRGWLYYVTIGSTLAILCLSANTSFVDFPRLCRLLARDNYLPQSFGKPSRRLVYAVGILFLSSAAGLLMVAFRGITNDLIPLFAVGAFLAFTLSQAGMAVHWRRNRSEPGAFTHFLVNGGGAVATGFALIIILSAKFIEGAWIPMLVIPPSVLLLERIHAAYASFDQAIACTETAAIAPADPTPPLLLIPIERWDQIALHAVQYALRLSPDVVALHLTALDGPDEADRKAELLADWTQQIVRPCTAAGLPAPDLIFEASPYRSVLAPLLRTMTDLRRRHPGRAVAVILPEIVTSSWWQFVLQTHRDRHLRATLLRHGGDDIAVVVVPWQMQSSRPDRVIAHEE
jgi:amino acid transporter